MKLEETELFKLQHAKLFRKLRHTNHIQDFDSELAKKITPIRNIYEKNPNF